MTITAPRKHIVTVDSLFQQWGYRDGSETPSILWQEPCYVKYFWTPTHAEVWVYSKKDGRVLN